MCALHPMPMLKHLLQIISLRIPNEVARLGERRQSDKFSHRHFAKLPSALVRAVLAKNKKIQDRHQGRQDRQAQLAGGLDSWLPNSALDEIRYAKLAVLRQTPDTWRFGGQVS